MTRFLLAALAAVSLSACGSDYTDWESRGPDSSTAAAQKKLMLPPDFFLRAPVPAQKPAEESKKDEATGEKVLPTPVPDNAGPSDVSNTPEPAAEGTFDSPELAADEAAEPTDVRSNTPDPLADTDAPELTF